MSVSAETIQIVKSTVPLLHARGLDITTRMYELLFEQNPEVANMFPEKIEQRQRLATAIVAYAANIDNLDALSGAVEGMAQTHVGASVQPEHYPLVATALIQAMTEVLGEEVVTDAVVAAWSEAYFFLADILMAREAELYHEQELIRT